MQRLMVIAVLFSLFIILGSCTNNEGENDLDVLTPNDSTGAVLDTDLPIED